MAHSFPNIGYQNKISAVVKLIERWVMDVLKCEKMSVFLCNDIACIISISRRIFFNIKKEFAAALN